MRRRTLSQRPLLHVRSELAWALATSLEPLPGWDLARYSPTYSQPPYAGVRSPDKPGVSMGGGELSVRLADSVQQIGEPRRFDVECLAAFDALELNGAEFVTAFFVLPDYSRLAAQR
jgi:hypothetical protein